MGAKMELVDHTDYNLDGTIKYTPNDDGSPWMIEHWSRPDGFSDEMYKRWGWGDYATGTWHYNSSWDWIMPVVEKIESMKTDNYFSAYAKESDYNVSALIETDVMIITVHYKNLNPQVDRYRTKQFQVNAKARKIDMVYQCATDFITWYNSLTPTNNGK